MKKALIIIVIVAWSMLLMGQTYYNLKYTWEEIEDAVTVVRDSLDGMLAEKADACISGLQLEMNPGLATLVDAPVISSASGASHGYIFAVDGTPILTVAGVTAGDGDSVENGWIEVNGPVVSSGADFAEWFRSYGAIAAGTTVTFDRLGFAVPCQPGDTPFGVVTKRPGFIGNWRSQALGTAVLVSLIGQVEILEGQPVAPGWFRMRESGAGVELWLVK